MNATEELDELRFAYEVERKAADYYCARTDAAEIECDTLRLDVTELADEWSRPDRPPGDWQQLLVELRDVLEQGRNGK